MLTRNDKEAIVGSLKENLTNAKAIFLTNVIGVTSNDSNALRKTVREAKGSIVVTRNTLFRKAAEGTYAEELLKDLKGTNAVVFAYDEAPAVAKAIYDASKENDLVSLGDGYLGEKALTANEVVALAKLPSRDEMLGTLLATFNAPVSAFARLMNSIKDEVESQGVDSPSGLKVEAPAAE
jgi:large subunit ribosomal protein L10